MLYIIIPIVYCLIFLFAGYEMLRRIKRRSLTGDSQKIQEFSLEKILRPIKYHFLKRVGLAGKSDRSNQFVTKIIIRPKILYIKVDAIAQ